MYDNCKINPSLYEAITIYGKICDNLETISHFSLFLLKKADKTTVQNASENILQNHSHIILNWLKRWRYI